MRIVIIGVGEVGFHVAKALSQKDFDITVIDNNPENCRRASEHLDVIVVQGNGASPKNLVEADVKNADYVFALTRTDEVNLIASQQARELGANKVIARLRNQQYSDRNSIIKPEKFGIDLVIHPEKEACSEIVRLVEHPYATNVMDFEGGRLKMLGIRINSHNQIVGRTVKELCDDSKELKFGIVSVIRGNKTIVPWGDFVFKSNDRAYFIIKTKNLDDLLQLLDIPQVYNNRIMIFGGEKIGYSFAKLMQNEKSIRLVDTRREKTELIAANLKDTMVINADCTDTEFLKSENIQDVESFIAVTHDEKTNILSGMLAHQMGARQTIIHINTTEYLPLLQELGIGAVISKNMATVNKIVRKIYSDKTETDLIAFEEIDVDVIELIPQPGSKITQHALEEISFPKDSIVGVINHHGNLSIARGNSRITEEDTVLMFSKTKAIPRLRKIFGL
ncbi:MAG: Trk system potassium transporter TrkA [Candidatus Marinimicrobia bacterium]|nr:Trk system potassium transporter TrkA [Candidatus Neomarinimicrobiota bacterium]